MGWDEVRDGLGKKIIETALVCVMLGFSCFFGRRGNALPRWVDWKSGTTADTTGQYEVILRHRGAEVNYDSSVIWMTPEDLKVQDAMFGDIDGDGTDELILLCWKVGRFGQSRPFWVEEDESIWSQHIFVYSFDEDNIKPKWMSSYIGVDVVEMSVTQRGGRHRLLLTNPDGEMSSWIWDSWGFTREDTDITFVVFGDNLIHEPIYQYGLHKFVTGGSDSKQNSNSGNKSYGDFDFLFKNKDIKRAIKESDVAVINQETPLTDDPSKYSDYPRFGTPVGVGEAIADAGFDVVTCATNHALDQGADGVDYTKEFFDSRGILCIGIQSGDDQGYRPYEILVRNGVRFALFNYTYGINGAVISEDQSYVVHLLDNEEQVRKDIEKARAEADFIVVFVHWGTEYEQEPDEFQRKWTQVFRESGVDVVVGAHPHVLQLYEVFRDDSGHEMLVYYSVGNYISAQREQSCAKGGMAQFTVSLTPEGYRITEYSLQPLIITREEGGKYTVSFPPDSNENPKESPEEGAEQKCE